MTHEERQQLIRAPLGILTHGSRSWSGTAVANEDCTRREYAFSAPTATEANDWVSTLFEKQEGARRRHTRYKRQYTRHGLYTRSQSGG